LLQARVCEEACGHAVEAENNMPRNIDEYNMMEGKKTLAYSASGS
jgi:hypothetical protein